MSAHSHAFAFLRHLFGYGRYDDIAGALVEFRCFKEGECKPVRWWSPLDDESLSRAAEKSVKLSEEWDVYCGAAPRIGEGGTAQYVTVSRFLWCDIDGGDEGPDGSRRILDMATQTGIPDPYIIVLSGGGLHCYWPLSDPYVMTDNDGRLRFRELLRRLVRRIGGEAPGAHADPSCCDAPHVLRVVGSFNHKRGQHRPVKLLSADPFSDELPPAWWRAHLPALPLPAAPKPIAKPQDGQDRPVAPERLLAWASRGHPEGHRHTDLVSDAAWLRRDLGLSEDVALDLLIRKAQASTGRRNITETELRRMIGWA